MFKTLKNFLSSGVLVNPMVLLGILIGFIFVYRFDIGTIQSIFMYYDYYAVAFAIAFLYTIFFNLSFKYRENAVDWKDTMLRVFGSTFKLVLSNVLSVVFFYYVI